MIRPPLTTSMTGPETTPSFLDALDVAPGPLVLRPLLRQDQAAVLVLLGEDQGLDVVADGHDLVGVDVVADRQLAAGDDALGLVADVEEDLVPVDPDHRAGHDRAVLDGDQRGIDGVGEAAGSGRRRRSGVGCSCLGLRHGGGVGGGGAWIGGGGVGGLDVGHELVGFLRGQGLAGAAGRGSRQAAYRRRVGARRARLAVRRRRKARPWPQIPEVIAGRRPLTGAGGAASPDPACGTDRADGYSPRPGPTIGARWGGKSTAPEFEEAAGRYP